MERKIDYSFKVLEEMLTFRNYENREQVMEVAQMMLNNVENKDCKEEYKEVYREAYKKLDSLNFDENCANPQYFYDLFNKIINGEPLQYVLKSAPFHDFNLYVDKRVLIPRFSIT